MLEPVRPLTSRHACKHPDAARRTPRRVAERRARDKSPGVDRVERHVGANCGIDRCLELRLVVCSVQPKPAGLHAIVGKSIARFDIPGKVTGQASYVQDLRLPGMVHGRVVRPPTYGATLKSLDDEGRVIYVGSLSKTLFPGLRLGFMVGPKKLSAEARALRRLMVRHAPNNNQRTAALFLSLGHHDTLIRRLHRAYR